MNRLAQPLERPPICSKNGYFAGYTFVDYATQIYSMVVAGLVLVLHDDTVPVWGFWFGAHLAGSALIHWLVTAYARAERPNRPLVALRHFYPVLTYLWFFTEIGQLDRMVFSEFMDPHVVRLEQWLFGFQPSRGFMEALPYLVLSEVFYASYFSYYIMIVGVGIVLFRRNRDQFFHYISVVSFIFYCCYFCYLLVPIVGPPIFYFQGRGVVLPEDVQALFRGSFYPETVQQGPFFQLMALLYRIFDSPGAALPSSHVTIALTTVSFSYRYLRSIRHVHLAIAILLCMATVYCRYHYVVDLVAGLVAAAVLIPVGNRLYFRYAPDGVVRPGRASQAGSERS